MVKLFIYLGDIAFPYRTIMDEKKDVDIHGTTVTLDNLVIAEQIHSNYVHVCSAENSGAGTNKSQIIGADALITNVPNQILLIRTADCTPILLADMENQVVAAIHSGREGTRKNIVQGTIKIMEKQFGTNPEHLDAWVGPGICQNHYMVDKATWEKFVSDVGKQEVEVKQMYGKIDLQAVIYRQLTGIGVKLENIRQNHTCTYESDRHFSYRRDTSKNRQINLIGMLHE